MSALDLLATALGDRYRLERELGQGGMAIVYAARDLRHDRDVAIKVLHPDLGAVLGAERFLAEIKTTAQLQHPHILPLLDSGALEGLLYYVMPLVSGETLRALLAREKQLPIAQALQFAREVADALSFAHERGIVHRDIKPENLLLQSGHVLVADFGIALAVQTAGSARMTQTGLSLGTPQYMSPEQALGERTLDARTDIYALGCVLYEMLVGEAPFTGSTAQAIVARVLTERPAPISPRRERVSASLERTVLRAIEKLPADRWSTAKAFAAALDDADRPAEEGAPSRARAGDPATRRTTRWRTPVLLGLTVAATAAAAYLVGVRLGNGENALSPRFVLDFAANEHHAAAATSVPFAISPDGRTIVYAATRNGAAPRLYVRPVDELGARELPGTDGAIGPTFSPDGRWIAFLEGGRLKKTPVGGGSATTLATLSSPRGIAWAGRDEIVVGAHRGGLGVVSANGGVPRPLTEMKEKGMRHVAPIVLADGRTVLFSIKRVGEVRQDRIGIVSLDGGEATTLPILASSPLGVVDDHLIYVTVNGALMAVPFDVQARRATGPPMQIEDDVYREPSSSVVLASLSRASTLVFQRGTTMSNLVLATSRGEARVLPGGPQGYGFPRFSPDGRRIAVTVSGGGTHALWLVDRQSGTVARLADAEGIAASRPEWTPDGRRLIYFVGASAGLQWRPADNSAAPERFLSSDTMNFSEAVISPDGRVAIVRASGASAVNDLFYTPTLDRSYLKPFVVSPFYETAPRFSPDGHWVAFSSDETGTREVFVTAFPGPGPHYQASTEGGEEPVWAPDGRTLYYLHDAHLVAATVSLSPTFSLGKRETVLDGTYVANMVHANFDVSPDGKEFLLLRQAGSPPAVVVVLNWAATLRAKVHK